MVSVAISQSSFSLLEMVWQQTVRCVTQYGATCVRLPSGLYLWQCQATPGAAGCTGRWQRIAAAWAVRRQPYPAVGTELPVRFKLAAAIETLLEKLVKFFMELQE